MFQGVQNIHTLAIAMVYNREATAPLINAAVEHYAHSLIRLEVNERMNENLTSPEPYLSNVLHKCKNLREIRLYVWLQEEPWFLEELKARYPLVKWTVEFE